MIGLHIVNYIARPLKIFWDSNASMFYTKNNKISRGSKHLDLKYLTVKDLVKDGSIVVDHVNTNSMLADPLTKGLSLLFLDDMLKKWALWVFWYFWLVGALDSCYFPFSCCWILILKFGKWCIWWHFTFALMNKWWYEFHYDTFCVCVSNVRLLKLGAIRITMSVVNTRIGAEA